MNITPQTSNQLRPLLLASVIANIAAALVFAALAFLAPMLAEYSASLRFSELDRSGVINVAALKTFDTDYRFGDFDSLEYRRKVPLFLADAPLQAQRTNALLGVAVTIMNAIVCFVCREKIGKSQTPPAPGGSE